MGKAGMPYARSVQQTHPVPQNELPDANLVFDTLLKRQGVSPIIIPSFFLFFANSHFFSSSLILLASLA
jgi:hypothetical protein